MLTRARRMRLLTNDFLLYRKHPKAYRERHRGLGPLAYMLYYSVFKHGCVVFWDSKELLRSTPLAWLSVVATLCLERIYLFFALVMHAARALAPRDKSDE